MRGVRKLKPTAARTEDIERHNMQTLNNINEGTKEVPRTH